MRSKTYSLQNLCWLVLAIGVSLGAYKWLAPAEFDVDISTGPSPELPFHYAVFRGDLHKVRQFIAQEPGFVNSVDARGRTALHWAAFMRRTEVVRLLRQNGAEQIRDKAGRLPSDYSFDEPTRSAAEGTERRD